MPQLLLIIWACILGHRAMGVQPTSESWRLGAIVFIGSAEQHLQGLSCRSHSVVVSFLGEIVQGSLFQKYQSQYQNCFYTIEQYLN